MRTVLRAQAQLPQRLTKRRRIFIQEPGELDLQLLDIRL